VPLPPLTAAGRNVAAAIEDGSHELKYHHFSVVMHRTRRLAIFTASNVDWRIQSRLVDGKKPTREQLTGIPEGVSEQWVTDPRLPEEHQLPDIFFTKDRKAFDKGHLVRRDDVTWGADFEDMQMANGDTYHTTNCSPQTMQFNQGSRGDDNWGDLETMVQTQTKSEKSIVLGGPVLRGNDRRFFGVGEQGQLVLRIPREYWKMIVVKGEEGPRVYAFKLKQDLSKVDFGKEELIVPDSWKRYLVPVAEIEQALRGWVDLSWYKQFDQINADEAVAIAEGLR
jgi:endonuclease G, mitochondrial